MAQEQDEETTVSASEPTALELLSNARQDIADAAKDLKAASDELSKSISTVEDYLSILNVGVPAWVRVKGWSNERGSYWKREVGYDQFGDDWHLAIRETSGHEQHPDDDVQVWRFNSSPRKARISAIEKIPELLTELAKEARRTARRFRDKSNDVTAVITSLRPPPTKKAKQ